MPSSQWVKESKYKAQKTTINGIVFDSKKEAWRYCELSALERAGEIFSLERQVKFCLIPSELGIDGKKLREMNYVADFVYFDKHMKRHVEDVKGFRTDVYKIKKRLMWHIRHIEIEEV